MIKSRDPEKAARQAYGQHLVEEVAAAIPQVPDEVMRRWAADLVATMPTDLQVDTAAGAVALAAALKAAGYHQVSRSYRILARLPAGKTGMQALREASEREWYAAMTEADATDQFLRVYAAGVDKRLHCTVDIRIFEAFRRLGGGTAR